MNIKRIVSGLILFPIAAAILIFGNQYVVDATVALIAIMSIHEFYKAFRTGEKANPVSWVGYATAAMISLIHVLPDGWILKTIGLLLPISLCILILICYYKKFENKYNRHRSNLLWNLLHSNIFNVYYNNS